MSRQLRICPSQTPHRGSQKSTCMYVYRSPTLPFFPVLTLLIHVDGRRSIFTDLSRKTPTTVIGLEHAKQSIKNQLSQSEITPSEQNSKMVSGGMRETTPAYTYAVGESTLETLPGTITPPIPVYSPREKLTESCISVASTPTNLDCKLKDNDEAMVELGLFLSKDAIGIRKKRNRVCFIASDGESVDGRGEPIREVLSEYELMRRKKKHQKILRKRKNMWQNYRKAKMQKCTNKIDIFLKGVQIRMKKNEGDLI